MIITNERNLLIKLVNLFCVTELIVAESVTGEPITTQGGSGPDCNGLKCSLGTQFCDICCKGQGHKSGICVNGGEYYYCKCQN